MHVWTNLALTTPENIPMLLRSTTSSPARPPRRYELPAEFMELLLGPRRKYGR
jgi:hypothetical protein